MKKACVLAWLAAGLLGAANAFAADDPAMADLQAAAQAAREGNETRAWELFGPRAELYRQKWAELDGDFAVWVADQYRKQKRFKDAVLMCETAMAAGRKLTPAQQAGVMLVKGDVLRDQQNFAAARLQYESIDRNRDLRDTEAGRKAKFRTVDILRLTKDYDGALNVLERLKDMPDPDTQAEAYFLESRIAFDREDYPLARELIGEVKKRKADHVETVFLEAEINLREDRLQDPELELGSRVLTTYVVPGRPVTMRMQDRNLAVVRGGAGIPVEMVTLKGGDRELVTLLPSPRDPSLFRGSINTKLGDAATNSMRLEITGEDIISYNLDKTFQSVNGLKYEEKKMIILSDGEITATSGDFITSEERDEELLAYRMQQALASEGREARAFEKTGRDTTMIRPGNAIRVQVVDYDRDLTGGPDRVLVDAESSSGDRVTGVALVETEAHSGIFRGVVETTNAPPRATASDSAPGSNPGSVLSATDTAAWKSGPREDRKVKWLEIDLMTTHPLAEAQIEAAEAGALKGVSLFNAGEGGLMYVGGTTAPREATYGYVDLAARLGKLAQTAAYLYTEVDCPTERDVTLKIGSCDGVVCWVNGKKVHSSVAGRIWKPEEDTVSAHLAAGVNGILLKVLQVNGPWGASLTVVGADGKPLETMPVMAPALPGVVTQWYLFNRPTPEDVEFGGRITVDKPVRVQDKTYHWLPVDVTPVAAVTIEGATVKASFHRPTGVRKLRWAFDDFGGEAVTIKKATIRNRFGETLTPTAIEFSAAATNQMLELGPGDRIDIKYRDERRTKKDQDVLRATMRSGFHNGAVALAYETIRMDERGERQIEYDGAVRYLAGVTDRLVTRVIDYDADVSDQPDKVKVLVENTEGDSLWMEAIETQPHSGEFLTILRLGAATTNDTIRTGQNIGIRASYSDRENTDGQIERQTSVAEAADDPPELLLYQNLVLKDEEELTESKGPVVRTRLMEGKGASAADPVITSLDTAMTFKVVYPAAALSSNATYVARVSTEREIGEAKAAGREPAWTDVRMRLASAEDAEFAGEVVVRPGDAKSYADEEARERDLSRSGDAAARLYIKLDDVVRVAVESVDKGTRREGWYRLASDASMRFTDRRYMDKVAQVFAGDYVYLRLADRDRDTSDELDKVAVRLVSKVGTRNVELSETLPHSGAFSGRIKSEFAAAATNAAAGGEPVLPLQYGETIRAEYDDQLSVLAASGRVLAVAAQVYRGADGTLATFTKRFTQDDIAVKTRLLMAEALFELAKEHREGGQKELGDQEIAEGKTILEEAIADYPDTVHAPHAEFLLANLAQELEKYEEALERYNKVLSSWPDSEFAPKAQLKKGICLEKIGDDDNALDAYVELTYSYPKSTLIADAIIRLAQHFYRTKQFEVAGKIFGNFQTRHPEHELAAKALFLSGQSYMKGAEERKQELGGRYDTKGTEWLQEAVVQFDKLVSTYDDKELRAEAMYWLGDCNIKVGDMRNAYLTLKKLTWDYPESKWAKFARGQLVQNEETFKRFVEER